MGTNDAQSVMYIRLRVLGVVPIGLLITLIASLWLADVERRTSEALFLQEATERFDIFNERINDAERALSAVNRLFYTVNDLSREQFGLFVEPLLKSYPYILSFTYLRIIPKSRRQAYETGMQGIKPGFRITEVRNGLLAPSSVKTVYRVVDYIFPLAGNEDVMGVDSSSIAEQEVAVARAAKSDHIEASGLFRLVREKGKHIGFMMIKRVCTQLPEHQANGADCNVEGYTAAAFNVQDFIHKVLEQSGFLDSQDYAVAVYSGTRAVPAARLYAYPKETGDDRFISGPQEQQIHSRTFDIGGTTMHMVVASDIAARPGAFSGSNLLLILGLALTTLLATHIRSTSHRRLAEKKANEALQQDIALRKEAEKALLQSQAELRELARHQEQIREDERKHIVREIHDDLGQNLLVLRMDVTLTGQRLQDKCPQAHERIEAILGQIDCTVRSVRQIINNLRPPVLDLGPIDAVKWLVKELNKREKGTFTLKCAGEEALEGLSEEQSLSLFRILQEATANVLRHANASSTTIEIHRTANLIRVVIADDGSGMFANDRRKSRSIGLIGIRERVSAMGGEFALTAEPGKGTNITFTMPVRRESRSPLVADCKERPNAEETHT